MGRLVLDLEGIDQGSSYFSWQWRGKDPKVFVVAPRDITRIMDLVSHAIPQQLELCTESGTLGTTPPPLAQPKYEAPQAMLSRVLQQGSFSSPESELASSSEIARFLLPEELRSEIVAAYHANGDRPVTVRLSPSARTAQVPWELLPLDAEGRLRLIDVADLFYQIPVGVLAERPRLPSAESTQRLKRGASQAVYVLDPATRVEGSVLSNDARKRLQDQAMQHGRVLGNQRRVISRADLSRALTADPAPDRLVFIGHVSQAKDTPAATSMLLSDDATMFGTTTVISGGDGVNRPLSALDLLEGLAHKQHRLQDLAIAEGSRSWQWPVPDERAEENPAGVEIWPSPSRVLLIACNSGTDLTNPEAFGLAVTFAGSGATLVTATKWTLITDHGFRMFAQHGDHVTPLVDAVEQLDDAHRAATDIAVVQAIADWQRQQLNQWRTTGHIEFSPITWAAFSSYFAPVVSKSEVKVDLLEFLEQHSRHR